MKEKKRYRFCELEISRYCHGGGCSSGKKQKKRYKNQSTNPTTGSRNSHYAVSSVLHRFTMQGILQLKVVFRSRHIQTQLNFEISNGQQNSFTAETALIQRRVVRSIGKWTKCICQLFESRTEQNLYCNIDFSNACPIFPAYAIVSASLSIGFPIFRETSSKCYGIPTSNM